MARASRAPRQGAAWAILVVSAVLEAVWATALGESAGFTRPIPTVVFAIGIVLSMIGLERAARAIPIGTAYAVWVGLGAALTVGWAIAAGAQAFSWWTILFVAVIVAAVIGLKLTAPKPAAEQPAAGPPSA
ncbi:multidrug efflux SMR transporter [Agrococcus sp. SL85]|uniref:DMT family transporter n=1 Tax=Agrococcus sp. SL85 TaxID=2995141 RepID=UPI00226D3F2A|nr:multidrug efflux SMR transporter [Agrococcus sp. SL85]WAC66350.1 multidrug efflux SMR transporter [Agrococcus sp. SL85]